MPIKDFVVQSGCTFKYGVDFRGWTDKRYIHSLTSADDGIRSGLITMNQKNYSCIQI